MNFVGATLNQSGKVEISIESDSHKGLVLLIRSNFESGSNSCGPSGLLSAFLQQEVCLSDF